MIAVSGAYRQIRRACSTNTELYYDAHNANWLVPLFSSPCPGFRQVLLWHSFSSPRFRSRHFPSVLIPRLSLVLSFLPLRPSSPILLSFSSLFSLSLPVLCLTPFSLSLCLPRPGFFPNGPEEPGFAWTRSVDGRLVAEIPWVTGLINGLGRCVCARVCVCTCASMCLSVCARLSLPPLSYVVLFFRLSSSGVFQRAHVCVYCVHVCICLCFFACNCLCVTA